ncbi:hypothetical protein WI372_11965 [Gemmatimonadota bacterium DH-20]|uniref:Uncharacterized protein n=1 Tax=Gaopeijia maritima TaxID=3119007 RepID=A0ABU9EC49_9BACT
MGGTGVEPGDAVAVAVEVEVAGAVTVSAGLGVAPTARPFAVKKMTDASRSMQIDMPRSCTAW